MTPSLLLFYAVCFFAAYSQAMRPEFGPVRLSLPYLLGTLGLAFMVAERAFRCSPNRAISMRMFVPALTFVMVYVVLGGLAIVRLQTGTMTSSPIALFRVVEQLGRLVLSFCLMLLTANSVRSLDALIRALTIVAVSAGLVSMYGVYQVIGTLGGFYRPILPNTASYGLAPGVVGVTRATATMQEPSFLAGFLCFAIAVTAVLIVWRGDLGRVARAVLWSSLGLELGCLLMTTSTGGFAGVAVVLMSGLYFLRQAERRRFALVWLISAVLLALPIVHILAQPGFQRRLIIGSVGKMSHVSAQERTEFIRAGLRMFSDNPLIGVGPALYDSYAENYTRAFSVSRIIIVNNVYAELLAETGLVGFVSFMIMFACLFRRAIRKMRRAGADRPLHAAMVISLSALAVQFMAYPTFKMEFIWLLFGLIAAPLPNRESERAKKLAGT